MGTDRIARVNEQLRREVGANLFRVIHDSNVDMSAITVIKVITSRDLRHARVFVSVRGTAEEQTAFMQLLAHHRQDLQALINKDLALKYTPHIAFQLDSSIAKGHQVLDILSQLPPVTSPGEAPDHDEEDTE